MQISGCLHYTTAQLDRRDRVLPRAALYSDLVVQCKHCGTHSLILHPLPLGGLRKTMRELLFLSCFCSFLRVRRILDNHWINLSC